MVKLKNRKVVVIGAGFAGLAASTALADHGYNVTVIEKNDQPGGRARSLDEGGYHFDLGPSWYWMPDVFESYFERFNKKVSDYYQLERLEPSYRVFYEDGVQMDIPSQQKDINELFEFFEKGSATRLEKFMKEAEYKYQLGMQKLVYKPGQSVTEFFDAQVMKGVFKMGVFQNMAKHVRKYFSHPYLVKLMEFPVLFLGAMPNKIPALYSLMNYADMKLGTWYPEGGMNAIVKGMVALAEEKGVEFRFEEPIEEVICENGKTVGVKTKNGITKSDVVIAGADYHHVEQKLLPKEFRKYTEKYWSNRTMAPSSLLYYLGVSKRLKKLLHHNLFFDEEIDLHASEIYEQPQWPSKPLFYVSCTSQTDDGVAPEGHENVFILIPVAPGMEDTEEVREKYYQLVMDRLEKITNQKIKEYVVYRKDYAHNDFVKDYNAFKGNAYGLANTLMQTANLKPSITNPKVKNLYYTGQLTVPGPGVPPSLISGQLVADYIIKHHL